MKDFRKLLVLISALIFLLSACGKTSVETPEPSPTQEPAVVTQTPEPTPVPTPELTPEPVFPIDIFMETEEKNDDDKRIYLSIVTLNSALYGQNSPGFNLSTDILKDTIDFRDFVLQAAEEYPATDENHIRYGLNMMMEVACNGPEYLSVYVDYYVNTGGAHGNITRIPYTYAHDGTRLYEFMDLVNDGVSLTDVEAEINRQIAKIIEDMGPAFYTKSISLEDYDPLPSFYIQEGVMVIFFQAYEIAPYAYGIPMFEMPSEIFSIN